MIRRVLVAAAFLITAPEGRAFQVPGVFRASVEVVSVTVSVSDNQGPVRGLSAQDFELTDNGVPQRIEVETIEALPIDLTLVLTVPGPDHTLVQLARFVGTLRQAVRPEDRLRLIWVDDEVTSRLVDPEYDPLRDPVPAGWAWTEATSSGFRIASQTTAKAGWGVALADGLAYALMSPVPPGRQHLVVAYTDGWDTASTLEMRDLPKLAARTDAVMHAVCWSNPSAGPRSGGGLLTTRPSVQDWVASFRELEATVHRTGGRMHLTSNAFDTVFTALSNFRASYVLRYTPAGTGSPGWHDIRVKLRRPGSYQLHARRGYERRG